MKAIIKAMKTELETSDRMPIFEIAVTDRTGLPEYVMCDISIKGNSLIAQRDAVTTKEQRSKKIATTRREIDTIFSLDENLQSLYEDIICEIIEGDLYDLKDE
jgi:hypothetical protein